jgi:hypothetical protein
MAGWMKDRQKDIPGKSCRDNYKRYNKEQKGENCRRKRTSDALYQKILPWLFFRIGDKINST